MRINKLVYFFILVFFYSCNQEFKLNKFRIKKVNIRLTDIVGLYKNDCLQIENFDPNRKNKYVAINLSFFKEYFSDSTKEFRFGVYKRGFDGIDFNIENSEVLLSNKKNKSINLFDIKSDLGYIRLSKKFMPDKWHKKNFDTGNGCIDIIFFDSISYITDKINDNSSFVTAEKLNHELLIIFSKNKFLQYLNQNSIDKITFTNVILSDTLMSSISL